MHIQKIQTLDPCRSHKFTHATYDTRVLWRFNFAKFLNLGICLYVRGRANELPTGLKQVSTSAKSSQSRCKLPFETTANFSKERFTPLERKFHEMEIVDRHTLLQLARSLLIAKRLLIVGLDFRNKRCCGYEKTLQNTDFLIFFFRKRYLISFSFFWFLTGLANHNSDVSSLAYCCIIQ